ncbi:MAG: galactose-1-epimerase, partial [Verrucomicrobiae bacterium]|nr:galactose-1-epimerase [Verrucomicrobiae bacterium]
MILTDARVLATAVILFSVPLMTPAQSIERLEYGRTTSGESIECFVLTNPNGLSAEVMTWGATLIAIRTPDRQGAVENVTLSLGDFEEYEKGHPLLGSVVGRFANRIDTGGFSIDGVRYDLKTVNPKTGVHIHGGKEGFASRIWKAEPVSGDNYVGVSLTHHSPDGHEGYPGNLDATVVYRLTGDDALEIEYLAKTDKATHVNFT